MVIKYLIGELVSDKEYSFSSSKDTPNMFPQEIITYIFDFLDIGQQFRVSRVSKECYNWIRSNIKDKYPIAWWNIGIFYTDTDLYSTFVCMGMPDYSVLTNDYFPKDVNEENLQLKIIGGMGLLEIGEELAEFTEDLC